MITSFRTNGTCRREYRSVSTYILKQSPYELIPFVEALLATDVERPFVNSCLEMSDEKYLIRTHSTHWLLSFSR